LAHNVKSNVKLIDKLYNGKDSALLKYLKIATNLKFVVNPLQQKAIDQRCELDVEYANAANTNLTMAFWRYILYKAKYFENLEFACFSNFQRSGKSSAALGIALFFSELIGYKMSVEKDIYPNQHAFLFDVPKRAFNSIAIIDETQNLLAQMGSYVSDQELGDIQKIIAKEMIHTIQVFRRLTYESNAHYALEPIGKDYNTACIKCHLYDMAASNNIGYNKLLGYVIVPHYDKSVVKVNQFDLEKIPAKKLTPAQVFRLEYEKKKDAWNEDLKYRSIGERAKQRLIEAEKLSRDDLFNKCKTQIQFQAVARYKISRGYSEDEIKEIIALARNKKIIGELTGNVTGTNAKLDGFIDDDEKEKETG
jgi:Skp family chaperone for outer membrane proteins